ncbi:uncharacterized protein LOC108926460 [Scleropages formosus]|uniref:uncharacterized protein LOC108926460 n=1 Tax=Scleropages formosus TaxID=113540 RepID=UPI0010FA8323|nr:uncharacterized protein LOC108926460 [Scleropages formosus]
MGLIQNDSHVSSKHRRATVYESNGAVKSMEHLLTEESCSCEFLTCSFNVATKPKERKKSKQPTARTKKKVQQDDSDGKERLKTNCLHGEQAVTLSEIQNVASHHQEQQAEQLVNVNRAMISEPSLNSAISRRTYIVCLNEGNGFIGSQENLEATDMPVANSDCSDLEKYSSLTRNEAFQDVGLSNRTILPNTAGSNSSVMSHRRQKLRSQDTCVSKSQRGSAVNRKGNVFPDDVQTYVPVNGEQATAPILSGGHVSTEELRQDGGFVENAEQDTGVPREASKKLIIEERPSWEDFDTSFMPCSDWPVHMESRASSSCQKPASPKVPLKSEPVAHKASEGKALKSLTNTNWEVMSDSGRSRRNRGTVSYKEPSINCKMRRGDKFTDTKFLSSPIFKDKKKLKKRIPQQKADDSLIADLCIGYMD